MQRLVLFLILLCVALPAAARDRDPATARDPGGFYRFLHSFAPETAVSVWRGGDRPDLKTLLTLRGFLMGAPVYLRVFKDEGVIELWMKRDARFELFEVYPICRNSGALGPKQKAGDKQAPEGFYEVGAKQLNPNSKYHLALNMGYPNAYDKSWGRTGDALMIHGACASIGCYALTNNNIEEVYALVDAALANGQASIPIHAFPFRMTQDALIQRKNNKWIDFWVSELLPAYQAFDITHVPPQLMACDKTYEIMDGLDPKKLPKGCTAIEAWK
jgi:murein L,D-transpeptidase YafK